MILLVDFHVHFWLLLSKRAHLKGSSAKRADQQRTLGGGGGLKPPLPALSPPLFTIYNTICTCTGTLWNICNIISVIIYSIYRFLEEPRNWFRRHDYAINIKLLKLYICLTALLLLNVLTRYFDLATFTIIWGSWHMRDHYISECQNVIIFRSFFYLFCKFKLRKKITLQISGGGGAWPPSGVDGPEPLSIFYLFFWKTRLLSRGFFEFSVCSTFEFNVVSKDFW